MIKSAMEKAAKQVFSFAMGVVFGGMAGVFSGLLLVGLIVAKECVK